MKYIVFIGFYLVLSLSTVYGQILNVEKKRIDFDSIPRWLGQINLGLALQEQQGQIINVHLSNNWVYFSEKHSYMLFANLHLIKARGSQISSNGYAHFRIRFLRRKNFSYENFSQIQYDVLRGMRERILSGADILYQIKDQEKTSLLIATGFMYEYERWIYQEIQEVTKLWKNSSYISFRYDYK